MTASLLPNSASRAPHAATLAWLGIALAASALLPAPAALRSVWLAPWCEEAVCRWGVQAPLARRFGATTAVLASAAAFGLAHWLFSNGPADAWRAAATALPAAWIGSVFARTGRLAPCAAWHAGFNLLYLAGQSL